MTDRKKFQAGHQYPNLDMPVYYPTHALKSRRARARFRKDHGIMVRRMWRDIRKDMQRDGAFPGTFSITYLEPPTFTITTYPVAGGDPW